MRLFVPFFLLATQFVSAQIFTDPNYPKGYFRNPLGIPISLSGNFGELRPNHYHMGLDLKTQNRQNLPVAAAADGYIARVKVEPGGFGQAIYINHPNGFTTLYAHLNHFTPAVEAWVKQQQYARQSWQVLLELPPSLFPVRKGDIIAYSGNTGGSQAPHLHFEVRRTADDVNLNPLLFGLPLADAVAPVVQRLAFYDRTGSVYEEAPRSIALKPAANHLYAVGATVVLPWPRISVAIGAYDTQNGSSNKTGIYEAELLMDGEPLSAFRMNAISYTTTRYVNAHVDYRTRALHGPYLQHLSALPGYEQSIYKGKGSHGVLDISDGKLHAIRIAVMDAYKNTSIVTCKVRYNGNPAPKPQGKGKMFYPFMLDGQEMKDCEFFIGERCLYDSVHIAYARNVSQLPQVVSAIHTIGATYIPLHEPFLVRIRATDSLPDTARVHVVMQWFDGAKKYVLPVSWKDGWASAQFRDLGSFQLVMDREAPVIRPVGFSDSADLSHASHIAFTVKDNLGSLKTVRATLDGQWLRFSNDKNGPFIYVFDEKWPPGIHELVIRAEDQAGNITTHSFRLNR